MNYIRPDLLDKLAAEYVVGTLHGGARRRFQRLLREYPSARLAVEIWEERMAPMSERLSAAPPSDKLWKAIHARIDPQQAAAAAASKPSALSRWFNWRTIGSLTTGLALGVVSMAVVLPIAGPTRVEVPAGRVLPESYAGFLKDSAGDLTVLVSSLRRGKTVDIKVLRPITIPAGQTLQLWALFKDASPVAIGTIPGQGKSQITMRYSSEDLLAKATELAVSIEPPSSAAPQQPTGPFILQGPCAKFW